MGNLRQLVEHQNVRQRLHPGQSDHHHHRRQPHLVQSERDDVRGHESDGPRQGILGVSFDIPNILNQRQILPVNEPFVVRENVIEQFVPFLS